MEEDSPYIPVTKRKPNFRYDVATKKEPCLKLVTHISKRIFAFVIKLTLNINSI